MLKKIPNSYPDGDCFFCGPRNAHGLKLEFQRSETEPPEVVCRWIPEARFKGLGKVLHGGIQCGIFDEIMGWATHTFTGQMGVTGGISVTFMKPVLVGSELEARCRIASIEGRKVFLTAEIYDSGDVVATRAEGSYILLDKDRFEKVVQGK